MRSSFLPCKDLPPTFSLNASHAAKNVTRETQFARLIHFTAVKASVSEIFFEHRGALR